MGTTTPASCHSRRIYAPRALRQTCSHQACRFQSGHRAQFGPNTVRLSVLSSKRDASDSKCAAVTESSDVPRPAASNNDVLKRLRKFAKIALGVAAALSACLLASKASPALASPVSSSSNRAVYASPHNKPPGLAAADDAAARRTAALSSSASTVSARPVADVAEAPPAVNPADTAWVLVATILALMVSLPGLAMFYAGLSRAGSVNSMLLYHLATAALVSFIWIAFGYSVAFSTAGMVEGDIGLRSVLGSLDKAFLRNVTEGCLVETIPEYLWVMFQMAFAVVTPCILIGAVAERMKFAATMLFTSLWLPLVYLPIAHAVWAGPGALLGDLGALDFAGGLIVHVSAGFSGLVAATMMGPRKRATLGAHSIPMVFTGISLVWLGWMGFNIGSALSAGAAGAAAMINTQAAVAVATLTWLLLDKKPSVVGASCGVLAGLVAITSSAGFVNPLGAMLTGFVGAVFCRFAVGSLKNKFGYDDAFNAFGIHGFGGFVGNLLVGICAHPFFGGNQEGITLATQVTVQTFSGLVVAAFSMLMTYIIFNLTSLLCGGCRVSDNEEAQGVDCELQESQAYSF